MKYESKNQRDPGIIVNFFEASRDRKKKGLKIGLEFEDYIKVLSSALEFSPHTTAHEAEDITRSSILSLAKKGKITLSRLNRDIEIREKELLRKPLKRIVCITQISLDQSVKLQLAKKRFEISAELHPKFDRQWAEIHIRNSLYS